MTRKRGFTIVELIIVIAVIGVLAAILIPVFSNVIEKANRKSALSDAKNAITNYVAELTGRQDVPMPLPDAVVYVAKANKLYVFSYSSEKGGLDEYPEPFPYDKDKTFEENVDTVQGILVENGAIVDHDQTAWKTLLDQFATPTLAIRINDADATFAGDPQSIGGDNTGGSATPPTPTLPPMPEFTTVTPTYDEATDTYVFTIPAGTTCEVRLDMSQVTTALGWEDDCGPGAAGYSGIKIVDESGNNYSFSSFTCTGPFLDYKTAESGHQIGDANSDLAQLIANLGYNYTPKITENYLFVDYLSIIEDVVGTGTVKTKTINYVEKYNAGELGDRTFTNYLVNKYGSLDAIPAIDVFGLDTRTASNYGVPDFGNENGNGLVNGTNINDNDGEKMCHVEPDIINLLININYDYITTLSFCPSYNVNNWHNYCMSNPTTPSYDWKTTYAKPSYNFLSFFDMVEDQTNFADMLNQQFTKSGNTITGAIGFNWSGNLAGNAYQLMGLLGAPIFHISLTPAT